MKFGTQTAYTLPNDIGRGARVNLLRCPFWGILTLREITIWAAVVLMLSSVILSLISDNLIFVAFIYIFLLLWLHIEKASQKHDLSA